MNRLRVNHAARMDIVDRFVFRGICLALAERKKDFLNSLEKQFEPFIKSGKKQKTFDWTCIKKFYNKSKSDLKNLCALRIFCSFVFKLFYTFDCEDDQFIMKIIQIYRQVMDKCEQDLDLCENCMELNYPTHYVFEDLECSISILKSINEVQNIYKFTNREFYSELTIKVIYEGDYVFLQFLVKYGLSYSPQDVLKRVRIELQLLKYLALEQMGSDVRNDFVESIIIQLFTESDNPNFKRLLLTTRALIITLCKSVGDRYYQDNAKCLNLYALTVPEAAISQKDARDFLDMAFTNDRDFQTEVYSSFNEVFPATPSLPSPRSLKFLCRCKVRDCIQKSPTISAVFSQIHVPKRVKDYLLFLCD